MNREEVRRVFLELFLADVENEGPRSLDAYRALFPGHEEIIESVTTVIGSSLASDRRKRKVLIIKAEGVTLPTTDLVDAVEARLDDQDIDVRATVLGHIVRGGAPSFHDRMLAGRVGLTSVEALLNGANDVMTAWRTTVSGGQPTSDPMVTLFPIETVMSETRALLDGSSDVTKRRIRRMEEIQGVLAL